MTHVLVTGASGFVGRRLVAALATAGYGVRAAARDPSAVPAAAGVEPVTMPDLARPLDWAPLLAHVEAVVHLAGVAHVTTKIDASRYDVVNHEATAALAQAAAAAGIERLVFMSSIRAQTGAAADHPLTEADNPQPTEPYGISKLAAEAAVRRAGVPFTILRPVLIYGPGVKGNMATLLRIAELPFPLPFGGLANPRSMVAIDNLVSAIRFVLEEPSTAGELYVVADEEALDLAEIVAVLRKSRGRPARLFRVPPAWLELALRCAGAADYWERLAGALVVDASKLRAAGWTPVGDTRGALAAMARDAAGTR